MIYSDHNKGQKLMRIPYIILVLSVLLASVPRIVAQEVPDVLPKVVQHSEPIYPPLARQTRIQGELRVSCGSLRAVRYFLFASGRRLRPLCERSEGEIMAFRDKWI